ncbi:MAG: Yip1 family protein [Mariprofundaceae bacterium]|nr:Yip1 family protein [Mariprofundaceae bacterium]
MLLRSVVFIFLLMLSIPYALSATFVPTELKPWVAWVLQNHQENTCPFEYMNGKKHQCAWPDALVMTFDHAGGSFDQQWMVYKESLIALPGNLKHWPQDVTVDGRAVVVSNKRGSPYIKMPQGSHRVAGRFVWNTLPSAMQLPKNTGLLEVSIDAKKVRFPHMEARGRLWLNETATKKPTAIEDHVQVEVFRRIIDDVPLRMITLLDLNVTGQARELMLGDLLPDEAIPLSIKGKLPMRLEDSGKLRMQVRAGHWQVYIESRFPAPMDHLSFIPSDDFPSTEIWVFDAKPALRLVEITDVNSVDPRQTRLPAAWQHLPTYQIAKGERMTFVTKRRGDPEPSANVLNLNRHLWLDFDGGGYTFQDKIHGQMRHQWRLNMSSEMLLGRAVVNGMDQLVTHLNADAPQGIELRQGNISIEADGRYTGNTATLPALGWQDNFAQVEATLHLPPGWRLFAASGADSVAGASWLDLWNLLDIFLVLIASLAVHRLLGRTWGAVAFFCFVLSWHETGAPQFIWLLVIGCTALMQVAPSGRLQKSMVWMRYLSLLGLLIVAIPYSIDTVRTAIYPQLERPSVTSHYMSSPMIEASGKVVAIQADGMMPKQELHKAFSSKLRAAPASMQAQRLQKLSTPSYYDNTLNMVDPQAKVQTGPGLPSWQWSSVPIRWNGPVQQRQVLKLTLISPTVTTLLKLSCVILVLLLALRLAGVTMAAKRVLVNVLKLGIAGLLLAGSFAMPSPLAAAEMPSAAMLKELQSRLLKPPKCLPQCAQISRMKLDVQGDYLRILLEVHASSDVSIPIPGQIDGWMPSQVMLDGKPNQARRGAKNALWVYVPKGKHQLLIAGAISPMRNMQLPLPLQPQHIDIDAKGWVVKGVHQDGSIEKSLQLKRILTKNDTLVPKVLTQTRLPPFVTVQRTLRLGLEWQLETVVSRVSPRGSAIALEVPLVTGESVNTDGIRVVGKKAMIQFSAQQRQVSWHSVLQPTTSLSLTASDTLHWVELWRLDVSPVWHVELDGIPQIHHQGSAGQWYPQWQPWPGESLTIHVFKPIGIKGKTKTVDYTHLMIKPGQRATDVSLTIKLRSSQAEQHIIRLPSNAVLSKASINGRSQPLRLEQNGVVRLPISPGEQEITLDWQSPVGIATWWHTPQVNIGLENVNANIDVLMPESRWVLFVFGPQLGPAILFWGVLIVVVIIAIGLGRSKQPPLKTHQWLLLGIGLSQTIIGVAMLVVAWLFAMGRRKQMGENMEVAAFNTMQVFLALFTGAALIGLISAVGFGLLGHPDMQISGNGSTTTLLKWYADQSTELLPVATVVSVPMWFYRILMLAWSLWLAFALLGWLKWAWQCFLHGGLWKQALTDEEKTDIGVDKP